MSKLICKLLGHKFPPIEIRCQFIADARRMGSEEVLYRCRRCDEWIKESAYKSVEDAFEYEISKKSTLVLIVLQAAARKCPEDKKFLKIILRELRGRESVLIKESVDE